MFDLGQHLSQPGPGEVMMQRYLQQQQEAALAENMAHTDPLTPAPTFATRQTTQESANVIRSNTPVRRREAVAD